MRIEDSRGIEITNFADWAKIYATPQASRQWKKGRSAYSAAEFIIHQDGARTIRNRVAEALCHNLKIELVVPEYEVRFDELGRGRVHDIALFGTADNGKTVFIGVEAKVDEPFGALVKDSYLNSKAKQIIGTSTNAPERIEKLLAMHFHKPDSSMFDIRYQLLYATAGTIAEGADISVLFVIVFKTALYNERIAAENYQDYINFMQKVGASSIKIPSAELQGHEIFLQDKRLVCLHEYIEL
ncbi:DUF6946 family protein [Desulfogranum marinum]|uniref:DUF6946 family protein n=1 Tax=Desulfogranum marinum TaxID=453220 RepID=UPI0019636E70|nr:hypothetical protein [Desulfogranum marinum]MBM9514417.1 hypothetical protein [Desulfogranum marinum]